MARGYRDEDDDRDHRDDDQPPWRQSGVKCIQERGKAIQVRLQDGDEQWFPKSVLHDDSEVYELGHEGTIVVQVWFAEKEGL